MKTNHLLVRKHYSFKAKPAMVETLRTIYDNVDHSGIYVSIEEIGSKWTGDLGAYLTKQDPVEEREVFNGN